jgi:hypothetical protein
MQFGFAQYPEGQTLSGHDFRRNMDTAWELDGQYATDVFTNESVNIIRNHNRSRSLFLYVDHLAVHTGNAGKPLEAPQQSINNFRYIPDPNRRTLAGKFSFNLLFLRSLNRRMCPPNSGVLRSTAEIQLSLMALFSCYRICILITIFLLPPSPFPILCY